MLKLKIENMTCNHCINTVTNAIVALQSDAKIEVELAKKVVKIDNPISPNEVLMILEEVGYPATITGCCSPR